MVKFGPMSYSLCDCGMCEYQTVRYYSLERELQAGCQFLIVRTKICK